MDPLIFKIFSFLHPTLGMQFKSWAAENGREFIPAVFACPGKKSEPELVGLDAFCYIGGVGKGGAL
jgi:hypothetical protein